MTRSPETRKRQLAGRLELRAESAKVEAADAAVAQHLVTVQARAALPQNPLASREADWSNYRHLPPVWADLARKQFYEITALEVAALLAATIKAATSAGSLDGGRVVAADSVYVGVARKASPFAADFYATWHEYWKQQA